MSGRRSRVRIKYSLRRLKKLIKKHPITALIIAAVAAFMLIFPSVSEDSTAPAETVQPREGVYVHYIDVGQGDSELIECNGEYMLIDGGDYDSGDTVVSYLRAQGVTELNYLVCSHGDADHCGGLDEVTEAFDIGTVFISPYNEDKYAFELFVETAEAKGIPVEVPDMAESYTLGGAEFKFLAPTEDFGDNNENSLVLRLSYGSRVFLFTGDIQYLSETALLDGGAELKCDVLKVAHHGSYTSTGYRFLYEAQPEFAVISCGKDNSYGHPHEEVLSRLRDAEVTVYRTDTDGTVIIHSDGETLERIG